MSQFPTLSKLDNVSSALFEKPAKRIHDGADVTFFLTSTAYRDIMTFILQLNRAMIPRKIAVIDQPSHLDTGRKQVPKAHVQSWPLGSSAVTFSEPVTKLQTLLTSLRTLVDDVPPDPGPRRFGNVSFRTWMKLAEDKVRLDLFPTLFSPDVMLATEEIQAYLLGSFGSPQRLDYGTGHELSFLAFLGGLWKLNYFDMTAGQESQERQQPTGAEERGIVLGVFEQYLDLIRLLIKRYNLEPAGSHGVWGLDDNSFLPYVFGSAQFAPAIDETDPTPLEGSLGTAPDPSAVAKQNLVAKEQDSNLYFSAIAFIYDVKKGPFWEHSPMLFDISGIKDGWGKINKGMLKMYNAEVLSKFPVVQHFPFGTLFEWKKDPEAKVPPPVSAHRAGQPLRDPLDSSAPMTARPTGPLPTLGAAAPRAGGARASQMPPPPPTGFVNGVTQAPWASQGRAAGSLTPSSRRGLSSQVRRPDTKLPTPAPVIEEESQLRKKQ